MVYTDLVDDSTDGVRLRLARQRLGGHGRVKVGSHVTSLDGIAERHAFSRLRVDEISAGLVDDASPLRLSNNSLV